MVVIRVQLCGDIENDYRVQVSSGRNCGASELSQRIPQLTPLKHRCIAHLYNIFILICVWGCVGGCGRVCALVHVHGYADACMP